MEKEELKKEIDKLEEYHQHIDQKQVRHIFNLIVNELYSLKKKLGKIEEESDDMDSDLKEVISRF